MNIDFWEWQSQCSHNLTAAVDVSNEPFTILTPPASGQSCIAKGPWGPALPR